MHIDHVQNFSFCASPNKLTAPNRRLATVSKGMDSDKLHWDKGRPGWHITNGASHQSCDGCVWVLVNLRSCIHIHVRCRALVHCRLDYDDIAMFVY